MKILHAALDMVIDLPVATGSWAHTGRAAASDHEGGGELGGACHAARWCVLQAGDVILIEDPISGTIGVAGIAHVASADAQVAVWWKVKMKKIVSTINEEKGQNVRTII